MDMPALINNLYTIHSILKITYELSNKNTSSSFYIIIKGHHKELKHNSVILSLDRKSVV